MRNLKITLAYDGADFHGWQVQPGCRTVQGTLAAALARIVGPPAEDELPQGAGRTDAGVHALAQVALCQTNSPIPAANLKIALNDALPPAIRVLAIEEAPADFHPRASARAKTYRYRIFREAICPPFLARYVYHHPYPLDEAAMSVAAAAVIGKRDFTSFAAVDAERSARLEEGEVNNVREIFSSAWERQGEELVYTVRGSGFLHHMVRNLVGTFLLVGKGTLRAGDVARIVAAQNRTANPGATAPASGLYLVGVEY